MEELTKDMNYYHYYLEAYTAVLGGMVGTFQAEVPKDLFPNRHPVRPSGRQSLPEGRTG